MPVTLGSVVGWWPAHPLRWPMDCTHAQRCDKRAPGWRMERARNQHHAITGPTKGFQCAIGCPACAHRNPTLAGDPCAQIRTDARLGFPFAPLHAPQSSHVRRCPFSALAGQWNSPRAGNSPLGALRNVRQPRACACRASSRVSTLAMRNARKRQNRASSPLVGVTRPTAGHAHQRRPDAQRGSYGVTIASKPQHAPLE